MNKNKKEFMINMEVYHTDESAATRGNYFYWGADKIEAINKALDEMNEFGLRIKKIYSVGA